MLVLEPFRLYGGEVLNAAALLAERNVNGSGNAFAHRDARFDFFADGFDGAVRAQEAIRESFVFAEKPEQQMLGLDVRAAILAGLVPREEDYAPGLFCVALKHGSPSSSRGRNIPWNGALRGTHNICSLVLGENTVLHRQHPVRSPRQRKVMGCKDRSQVMGPVDLLHEFENRLRVPLV